MSAWFYVRQDARSFGPLEAHELKEMARAGTISPGDMLLREGSTAWRPASRFKGLFEESPPKRKKPETREEIAGRLLDEMDRLSTPPKEPEPTSAEPPPPVPSKWRSIVFSLKVGGMAATAVFAFYFYRYVSAANPAGEVKKYLDTKLPAAISGEQKESDPGQAPLVRKSHFKKLQEGMTHDDVVDIVGSEGAEVLTERVKQVQAERPDAEIVGYVWRNVDNSHMSVIFADDELIEKAQYALY